MGQRYQNFIDGEWMDARSGKTFENRNPANREDLIGLFPASAAQDVDLAVRAARKALASWKLTPAPKRAEVVFRAGDLLIQKKEEIAALMTREMGKVLKETRGDVQEGIDTAFYAAGEGRRLFGQTTPSELPNKFALSIRVPVGVCGLITPWNFPMAIPTWKLFPALVCGNTAILKPASDTPATASRLTETLIEAGLPSGVVNLIHGSGLDAGDPLIGLEGVDLVSFTGSTEVGRRIAARAGEKLQRVSLEMGGKNPQIVMEDADLDLALEGALWGAFGTAGQRCTATSRLILHRDIRQNFTERLVARAEKLKLGDGLDESVEMGPLINQKQREKVDGYVRIGREEGARLLTGGRYAAEGSLERGFFYEPTIFDRVDPSMRIAREEIFGPVVAILEARDLDEAISIANDTKYGLSSSLYTRDVNRALNAIRDLEAGITYINSPTIGAEVHLPFGGVKETGNGHREGGSTVLDIFSEWKSVFIDYSGKLQKAQIDT